MKTFLSALITSAFWLGVLMMVSFVRAGNLVIGDYIKPYVTHCARDKEGHLSCWYNVDCNTCQLGEDGNPVSCTAMACPSAPWTPPCDPKPGEECTSPPEKKP